MFLDLNLSLIALADSEKVDVINLLSEVEIIAQLKLVRALYLAVDDWKTEEIPKEAILKTLGRLYDQLTELLDLVMRSETVLSQVVIEPPKKEEKTIKT